MKTKSLAFSVIGLTSIGIVVGLTVSQLAASRVRPSEPSELIYGGPPVAFHASYLAISFEDMVRTADIIVSGSIVEIGKTKFNQDSGEFWEETFKDEVGETRFTALPYYEVTISPEHVVFDPGHVTDQQIAVSLVGMSPSDTTAETDELGLRIGSEIVAFVSQGELAWWSGSLVYDKPNGSFSYGMKPVLQFMGAPFQSYLVRGEDGLFRFSFRPDQPDAFTLAELEMFVQGVRSNQ